MAIGPRLVLRQSQSLVMTPQLRQAIKLLQFSNLEASAFVEEELERNPLLERDEPVEHPPERPAPDQLPLLTNGADVAELVSSAAMPADSAAPLDTDIATRFEAETGGPGDYIGQGSGNGARHGFETDERGIDDLAEAPRNLRAHLGEQLRLTFTDPAERLIAAHLIALLDPAGRITTEPAQLADALRVPVNVVEAVRAKMMRFDPPGLFARDLAECLAAQLAERNRLDPAMRTLLAHLDLLARRDLKRLMALCGVDADDLADMIAEIRALDPKPAAAYEDAPLQPVIPDVLMRRGHAGDWLLELNPETMPRVLVNDAYHARIITRPGAKTPREDRASPGDEHAEARGHGRAEARREERAFLAEKLSTANWLVKSLQQRAQTILKVAGEIVRQQEGFFLHGVGYLRPLILRDIADAVELHESTVSRVTANKYMATPRGTFELKFFFTAAINAVSGENHSAESVRHRIRHMVTAETATDILSDDAIVAALRREGVDIARRTVAKYREALRIPSSVQRKRDKA